MPDSSPKANTTFSPPTSACTSGCRSQLMKSWQCMHHVAAPTTSVLASNVTLSGLPAASSSFKGELGSAVPYSSRSAVRFCKGTGDLTAEREEYASQLSIHVYAFIASVKLPSVGS